MKAHKVMLPQVIKKLSYFISLWFTVGNKFTAEDFKSAEENYQDTITDYLKPQELDDAPTTPTLITPSDATPSVELDTGTAVTI